MKSVFQLLSEARDHAASTEGTPWFNPNVLSLLGYRVYVREKTGNLQTKNFSPSELSDRKKLTIVELPGAMAGLNERSTVWGR